MFRNKILVRAALTAAPFLLTTLTLSPSPSASPPLIETLCCKLSRAHRLACLPQHPHILLLYQPPQSDSAARVVAELTQTLDVADVSEAEEVREEELVARAVECGLQSVMLDGDWRCVAESTFVESSFERAEERTYLHALNVAIQQETDGHVVFLVSPDVVRFNRHKFADFFSSKTLQRFDDGEEITLEESSFSTHCTILPFLQEGHVIGLSKLLPFGESFEKLEELWLFKYGLLLASDYFICVQLMWGGHMKKQWFPSSYVLQGPGLVPAPQTIRSSKAMHAMESFIKVLGAWDFFDRGLLKVKGLSPLIVGTSLPIWKTATNNLVDCKARNISNSDTCEIFENFQLTLDFRTPKPILCHVSGNGTSEHAERQSDGMPSCNVSLDSALKNTDIPNLSDKFRPLFMKRTISTHSTFPPERQSVAMPLCTASQDTTSKITDSSDVINSSGKLRPLFVKHSTSAESTYALERHSDAILSCMTSQDTTSKRADSSDIINSSEKLRPVFVKRITSAESTSAPLRQTDALPSCKMSQDATARSTHNSDVINSSGELKPLFGKRTASAQNTSAPDRGRGSLASSKPSCTESGCVNDNIVTEGNHIASVTHMPCISKTLKKKDRPQIFPDCKTLVDRGEGCTESGCANDIIATKENHVVPLVNMPSSSKSSRMKGKTQAFVDRNSIAARGKGSESGYVNVFSVTKENHVVPETHMLSSSKSSRTKGKTQAFVDRNSIAARGKGSESGYINVFSVTKENHVAPETHMLSRAKSSRKKEKSTASIGRNVLADRGKGCAESGCIGDIIVTKENHVAPVVHTLSESASIQFGEGNTKSSSKALRKKEKTKSSYDSSCLADRGEGSGCVNDVIITKENHVAPVVHMLSESTSIQIDDGDVQLSSKASTEKEKTQSFLDYNNLADKEKESGWANDIISTKENFAAPVVSMLSESTTIQIGERNRLPSSKASTEKEHTLTFLDRNSFEDQGYAESRCVNDVITTKENHASVAHMLREGTSVQMADGDMEPISKTSGKDEKTETFLDHSLAYPGKIHGKDDTIKCSTKKRPKPDVDRSDILAKVADYYTRGRLQSLTVPDLKGFLSVKKAKVGGKKEELIQRITALLA